MSAYEILKSLIRLCKKSDTLQDTIFTESGKRTFAASPFTAFTVCCAVKKVTLGLEDNLKHSELEFCVYAPLGSDDTLLSKKAEDILQVLSKADVYETLEEIVVGECSYHERLAAPFLNIVVKFSQNSEEISPWGRVSINGKNSFFAFDMEVEKEGFLKSSAQLLGGEQFSVSDTYVCTISFKTYKDIEVDKGFFDIDILGESFKEVWLFKKTFETAASGKKVNKYILKTIDKN